MIGWLSRLFSSPGQAGEQIVQSAQEVVSQAFYSNGLQDMAAQQQAAMQNALMQQAQSQESFAQQLGMQQTIMGMPIIENLQTFEVELKINGIPEPDLKEGDLLGVDLVALNKVRDKISLIKYKGMRYRSILDSTRGLYDTHLTYRGQWAYDEKLEEYLIQTDWTDKTMLPMSMFFKLPRTLDECIEVLEKSLWSSRKSPISKKDIA